MLRAGPSARILLLMNTTQIDILSAGKIVRRYTAFGTATEMLEAMARGYVPTVSKRRQASLLRWLRAHGLPAFVVA